MAEPSLTIILHPQSPQGKTLVHLSTEMATDMTLCVSAVNLLHRLGGLSMFRWRVKRAQIFSNAFF
jgi:hypothetical protein